MLEVTGDQSERTDRPGGLAPEVPDYSGPRLAVVLSHPIQHFCPMFASWARSGALNLRVFFASRAGIDTYFDPNFGREISWSGLQLNKFEHRFLNGLSSPPIDHELDAPSLEMELQSFDPEAVLTFGYSQRIQRRARKWAVSNGRGLLFFSDSELRQHRPLWKSIAKQFAVRSLLREVDYFIVTGNANEAYYRHYGVEDRRFIRGSYPIDWECHSHAYRERHALRRALRASLGIPEDQFVFATVGKLVPWKRQSDLIDALGQVPERKAMALVIGSGEMQAQWEALAHLQAPGRARLTGFVPAHELPQYLAASDVYVHCAEREPHSVAISEAIAMGLPVIVSHRCGSYGTDDDVRHGVNGVVYRCGDVGALAKLLRWCLRHRDILDEMAQQSHEIGSRQQRITHERLPWVLARLLRMGCSPNLP